MPEFDNDLFAQLAVAVLDRDSAAAQSLANLFPGSNWAQPFAESVLSAQATDLHRLQLVLTATAVVSSAARNILACDFAEHVLHVFEAERVGDHRPRAAIEAGRKALISHIAETETSAFAADAWAAADEVLPPKLRHPKPAGSMPGVKAHSAALAAFYAAHSVGSFCTGNLGQGAFHARNAQRGELPWQVERTKSVLIELLENGEWNPSRG